MVKPLVQGTKECIKDISAGHGEMVTKLSSEMDNLVANRFHALTEETLSRFKQQVYHPNI